MKLKRYSLFSVLFIIVIGIYIEYYVSDAMYGIVIFGDMYKFPVAIWVMIPMMLFYIGSLLHMFTHGLKYYFRTKSINTDFQNFVSLIIANITDNKKPFSFKNEEFQKLARILDKTEIRTHGAIKCEIQEVDEISKTISAIESGEYVKLKKGFFPADNKLYIQNRKNKLDIDSSYVHEVLKKSSEFSEELVKYAFMSLVRAKDGENIKKYLDKVKLDKKMLFELINEFNQSMIFDSDEIVELIKPIDLNGDDYIEIVRALKQKISPDELLLVVQKLQYDNEELTEALIYVYIDLEMIEKAKELLEGYDEGEFINYRSFLILKDSGYNFTIDKFLDK